MDYHMIFRRGGKKAQKNAMRFVKIPKQHSSAHGFRNLKQTMHIQSMDKTPAQEKYPESQNIQFWRHVHFPFQTSALESTGQKSQ